NAASALRVRIHREQHGTEQQEMDERFAQQFLHGRKNRSTPRILQRGLSRMIAFPSCLSLTNINSTRCRFSVLAVAKSVSRSHLQRACSARSQRRDERVSSRDLRVRFAKEQQDGQKPA